MVCIFCKSFRHLAFPLFVSPAPGSSFASVQFTKQKAMEKQNKVPMIYGYAVCLVTVITLIFSVTDLINAVIDLGDPLHAERNYHNAPSLASFENYKMDLLTSEKELAFVPDDETLKTIYQSAKDDKIRAVKHRTNRTIVVCSLLIVICVILFSTHWFWMRKLHFKSN